MKLKYLILIATGFFFFKVSLCQTDSNSLQDSTKTRFIQDSINGVYIPKDLEECFKQIDSFWNDSVKTEVKSWTEDEFHANTHFGFGMWIRNNWGLWSGSRLQTYFRNKGIFHPDDMSGIILSSYYRYLTGKKIELKKQIKYYKTYWKKTQSRPRVSFVGKTNSKKIYGNIDTALFYKDSVISIELKGYRKLPRELFKFNYLKELTLENCPNLDLKSTFKKLKQIERLETLNLFELGIKEYPDNLGELLNLKELWLSADSISVLPSSIINLSNLNVLIITECPMINLEILFNQSVSLGKLRELDLSENELENIPFNISQLNQLTDLWFENNKLLSIPAGIKSMHNLNYLTLFDNEISYLNLEKGDLTNLNNINLCYNKFESFPLELLYLENLERITMWANKISVISDEASKLKKLKYLNLQYNDLSEEQKEKLKRLLPETELIF